MRREDVKTDAPDEAKLFRSSRPDYIETNLNAGQVSLLKIVPVFQAGLH